MLLSSFLDSLMYASLEQFIKNLDTNTISDSRKEELKTLIEYVKNKRDMGSEVKLNFICTHNSRRSQLSQIWAQTVADYFDINVKTFSGGVEVTAFNKTAVDTLQSQGFEVESTGVQNPLYELSYDENDAGIVAFSKLFDHPENPQSNFAAIMTCSHADENCPFIPGAEVRIPVRYEDPKIADGTPQEQEVYASRSIEIATEMKYVFAQVAG